MALPLLLLFFAVPGPSPGGQPGGLVEISLSGWSTMQFVRIPPGSFTMGSPDTEEGRNPNEGPQHEVTISKGFLMGKYEVTQAQYEFITGRNPSFFVPAQTQYSSGYSNTDNHPVDTVSWFDAVRFCNALGTLLGKKACYTNQAGSTKIMDGDSVICQWGTKGFRLPTEAEWEYACRAGASTSFYWGPDHSEAEMKQYCWYDMNSWSGNWTDPHAEKGGTQPIGSRLPNAWGLHDMSGNVWEWCWDCSGASHYPASPIVDPKGEACLRVLRGGGWGNSWDTCRSSYRVWNDPTFRHFGSGAGFRVVFGASDP